MFKEKVFYISIVSILTLALSGCGRLSGCLSGCAGLFPSPPNTLNRYLELRGEGEARLRGLEYRAALAKYKEALKNRPHSDFDTMFIDANYPALMTYRLAFCHAKLAEDEGDVSLYIKAEELIKECYETAIVEHDRLGALYLWGYILFKQERYEEAGTKFEALIEITQQREYDSIFTEDAMFGLGKVSLELGDVYAARRIFALLRVNFPNSSYKDEIERLLQKQ